MEIGDSGVRGTHAVRHASKERNHELVNATRRLRNMAESRVKGIQVKLKFVTRIFRAQVISIVCSIVYHLLYLAPNPIALLTDMSRNANEFQIS